MRVGNQILLDPSSVFQRGILRNRPGWRGPDADPGFAGMIGIWHSDTTPGKCYNMAFFGEAEITWNE